MELKRVNLYRSHNELVGCTNWTRPFDICQQMMTQPKIAGPSLTRRVRGFCNGSVEKRSREFDDT